MSTKPVPKDRHYENHSLSELFPIIDNPEELQDLAEDIKVHGLREDIILHEGKILDGRNRLRACILASVEARFRPYEGNDPLGFVLSLNLHRRHLTTSQRAMVAAKLANMHGGERTDLEPSVNSRKVSQTEAGKKLSVSKAAVEDAAAVTKRGAPELQKAVEQGQVSVSAAAAVAKLPANEQRAVVAGGKEVITETAKGVRDGSVRVVSSRAVGGKGDPCAKPEIKAFDPLDKLAEHLPAHMVEAIREGTIKLAEDERMQLACNEPPRIWPEAVNLMHANGKPLNWALRIINKTIDGRTRADDLIHRCISAGGKWTGLFNLDAFRITVERVENHKA